MPISTTMVSTNEPDTIGGPQMKARRAPDPLSSTDHEWSTTMTALSRACITRTATTGGNAESRRARTPVRRIAKNDSSHIDANTTDSGNGQNLHAVVNALP